MRVFVSIILFLLASVLVTYGGELPAPGTTGVNATNAGVIHGQIKLPDRTSSEQAILYLFDSAKGPPPSREKYWRVPDHIEALDKDGLFSIEVPAGTYYLIATKRALDAEIGPPLDGDILYFNGDVKENPLPLTVSKGARLNVGLISRAYPYSRSMLLRDKGVTMIGGVVLDSEGKPVQGALVFASVTAATQGRPLFVSERTGKDGKFFLRVHDGGIYYLRVRGLYGAGAPVEGELLSDIAGDKPIMVSLKKEETIQGITLKVKPFSRRASGSVSKKP